MTLRPVLRRRSARSPEATSEVCRPPSTKCWAYMAPMAPAPRMATVVIGEASMDPT